MNKVLVIRNLKKNYHTPTQEIIAVKDFSYSLEDGEMIAIVGPSGCGKSTILSILSNIEKKSYGLVDTKHKTIGCMLQQDNLFDWLTVYENCILGLKIKKMLNTESINYVKKLIDDYGLKDFTNSYPSSLSGGMRQRVA
jgi:NitT/TauT family transport system ATP-binding protein